MESEEDSKKKTVAIVKDLVRDFAGTHRTVYMDRYYSSINVAVELLKMQLYVTGTLMHNRIPGKLTVKKFRGIQGTSTRILQQPYLYIQGQ